MHIFMLIHIVLYPQGNYIQFKAFSTFVMFICCHAYSTCHPCLTVADLSLSRVVIHLSFLSLCQGYKTAEYTMAFSGTANAFNLPNIKGNTGKDVSMDSKHCFTRFVM